jgi:glycosyltransferase involved in cell wall biosynthesis
VIVVHDGPADDETIKVVSLLAGKFEKKNIPLLLIATKEETGYYTLPRTMATQHARGDYIANLDDDNEWLPEHLSTLLAAIEDGEEWPDFVYSRRRYVLDQGAKREQAGVVLRTGDSPYVPWNDQAKERLASSALNNFIDSGDFLIGRGCMYRLALNTQMMWNTSYRRFGDYELMCRGVFYGGWRGKGVDAVTHIYHWHNKNVSTNRPLNEAAKPQAV